MTTFTDGEANLLKWRSVSLAGLGSITLDIVGGPSALLQVAFYDKTKKVLNGIGFAPYPAALDTFDSSHTSWPFTVPAAATSLMWGVAAYKDAAALVNYTATVNLLNAQGAVVATSSFSAQLQSFNDDIVYDGVMLTAPVAPPAALIPDVGAAVAGDEGAAQ